MKRSLKYLSGALVGALGFGSVAVAADFTLYGSVRSGIIHDKPEVGDGTWDVGSADAGDLNTGDRLWSRIGVRVSHDLGNGMTSGALVEKRLDGWRTRHQNVWLEGGMGRVTLGQQGSPYFGAVSWDGTNFTGGTWDYAGVGSRVRGVSFKSDLGGPFNFGVMVSDDDSPAPMTPGSCHTHPGVEEHCEDPVSSPNGFSDDAVDRWELAGSFDIGEFATLGLGYSGKDDDGPYHAGGTLGGSAGGLSWELGYQTKEDSHDLYGFHVGYGVGGGNAYLNYEDCNSDDSDDGCISKVNGADDRIVIVGYSYGIGPGTKVIAEHKNRKEGTDRTILALRVDF